MTNQEKIDAITEDLKLLMLKHNITNCILVFKEFAGNRGLVQLHQGITDELIKAIAIAVADQLQEIYGKATINNPVINPNSN